MTPLRRLHFPVLAPLVAAGLAVVLSLALVPPAEAAARPKKCASKHYAHQHPKACRPAPKPVWSPGRATTFNYPFATHAERDAIRHRVLKAVKNTPAGARIRLATFSYADRKMTRALIKAYRRGVSVQLLVNRDGERLGRPYDMLQRELGDRRKPRNGMSPAEVVDYNHSKYVAMSGTHRHRGRRFVWSGSMNFTGLGLYCDDLVFRLHGQRVVRAYFHNFHRVWRSPKASRPIPTRAFGTFSRLAPVPGAAGLSGDAGVAPETDELENPQLGVGELSGFDQD